MARPEALRQSNRPLGCLDGWSVGAITEHYSVELADWTGTNQPSPGTNCGDSPGQARSGIDDGLEPGSAPQVVEVRVAAGAGGGLRRKRCVHALEHVECPFDIVLTAAQCQQARDVIARVGIVGPLGDARVERLEGAVEIARSLLGLSPCGGTRPRSSS